MNLTDLRERLAMCADLTPEERDYVLAAVDRLSRDTRVVRCLSCDASISRVQWLMCKTTYRCCAKMDLRQFYPT